jgi:hypothetical protein
VTQQRPVTQRAAPPAAAVAVAAAAAAVGAAAAEAVAAAAAATAALRSEHRHTAPPFSFLLPSRSIRYRRCLWRELGGAATSSRV